MFTKAIIKAAMVAGALIVGLATTFLCRNKCGDDNPIEEVCEEIIEQVTGIDIDFTPSSEEIRS